MTEHMFASCPDGVETVAAMAPDAARPALQGGEKLRALGMPVVGRAELAARTDLRSGTVVVGFQPIGADVGDPARREALGPLPVRAGHAERMAESGHEARGGRAVVGVGEGEVLFERPPSPAADPAR